MSDQHKNLIVTISPTPYDKPLLLAMVPENARFFLGVAVTDVALVGSGGAGAPYAYTLLSSFGGTTGEIAPGVELNLDGTITGTPEAQGTYSFVAQVEDSASNVFPHSFSITIGGGLTAVVFQPTTGEDGVDYRFEFIVRDLTGTTITNGFSVSVGTLPDGLAIDGGDTNVISGTPTALAVGLTYVTIHVDDGTATLDIPVTFTIVETVSATYVEDRDPPNGWGGGAGTWLPSMIRLQDWVAHIVIAGGVSPYSISASPFNPPPAGINVYPSLLEVRGKTSEAASTVAPYLMSVFITDALGKTYTLQRAVLIVDAQQGRFQPQLAGVDIGPDGPTKVSFEVNTTATLDVENDGDTMVVKVPKPGTGGGGNVETVNGVGPDSNGNVEIPIGDGTVTAVNGVEPDTGGDISISGIGLDSHGHLTVNFPVQAVYQVKIQFKDEGSNLGTSGTVDTINWVGGGVTVTRVGDALNVSVPSGIAAAGVMYFGTGIDGDVTLDGTNTYSFLSKSGSIYTATRDLYLNNLSFGGTGQLNMVGFRLFVYGTWDPSGTSAQPSVYWPANNGANASAASLGAGGAVSSVAGQLANGCAGSNGVGGTATGTPGNPTAGASTGGSQRNNGGRGGPPSTIVASGGTGSSGSGGNSILSGVPTPFVFQLPYPNVTYMSSLGAISAIGGGGGGTGGGGASGNGVNPGGGGGGGGAGGNMVYIAARTIAVTNGLSGVAAVTGGNGGNGGTPISGTNCGSGGGGSGGGGGLIHVVFQSLTGSGSMTVTANGGNGGNAGTPTGTGTSGKGGTGGDGGLVVLFNVGAGTATSSTANAGSAGSGASGGAGGTSAGTLTP